MKKKEIHSFICEKLGISEKLPEDKVVQVFYPDLIELIEPLLKEKDLSRNEVLRRRHWKKFFDKEFIRLKQISNRTPDASAKELADKALKAYDETFNQE